MKDNALLPSDWVYKNVFNFSDDQIKGLEKGLVQDQKEKFRYSQIENEGNDPQESGESVGTPSDMATAAPDEGGDNETPAGSVWDQEEVADGVGRPKEVPSYGKDGSARDRDPIGKHGKRMALAHYDALKKSFGDKDKELLRETTESEELNKEYKEFTDKK